MAIYTCIQLQTVIRKKWQMRLQAQVQPGTQLMRNSEIHKLQRDMLILIGNAEAWHMPYIYFMGDRWFPKSLISAC